MSTRKPKRSPKRATPATPIDPLSRYDLVEAAERLRISRAHLFVKMRKRQIASIKDGKRRLIPGSEIVRLSTVQP